MSLHFLAAAAGALIAAVGFGVLVARCLRAPNAALAAWAIALFGLAVALGALALGFRIGFGPIAFRAMELGAQVIAPLALALGLSELAARSIVTRFAARLLIAAIAIVSLVIFATDPLSAAVFSKAWPAAGAYYQIVPNKLLDYVLAPAVVIVALSAMITAAVRPGRDPAWRDALAPAGLAGVAALLLAVPGIAGLLSLNVTSGTRFVLLCIVAAVGTWFAGIQVGRLSLRVLHEDAGDAWEPDGPWQGGQETGDFDAVAEDDEFGIYRSNGSRRRRDDLDYRGAADYTGQQAGYPGPPGYPRDAGYENQAGHLDEGPLYRDETGYQQAAGYPERAAGYPESTGGYSDESGALDALPPYPAEPAVRDERPRYPGDSGVVDDRPLYLEEPSYPAVAVPAVAGPAPGTRHASADEPQFFGQIAIYTLIEDRVADFDRLTRWVVRQVREHEPDTLVYIVHAVPSAPMQRILYEVYRDRAAHEAHKRQPYVVAFEADRRPFVLATNIIELGLQQAKVSPLPSVTDLLSDTGFDLLNDTGFGHPGYGPRPPGADRGGLPRG
jgi:quinol monooxygenase YgiN